MEKPWTAGDPELLVSMEVEKDRQKRTGLNTVIMWFL
jgi:hypothetical protein